jgi:GNAT superfamily N-acetyltransferase
MSSEASALLLRDLVREPDNALLDEIYQRIMVPAFREEEREPLESIRQQVEDPRTLRMLAYFDADSNPVAVITSDWYTRSGVVLIGYLAVRQDLRGQGVGTDLCLRAVSQWKTELNPVLAVAEVEDPRYFKSSPSTGDPEARVRLYERLGGRIIAVPYFQPSVAKDMPRVHHLMLMAFAANGELLSDVAVESVPTAPIGVFLEEYIEAAEGPGSLADPEFLELKRRVLSTPEVPLLGAEELDRLPTF